MACKVDRRSFLRKSVAAGAATALIRGPEEARLMTLLANPAETVGMFDFQVMEGTLVARQTLEQESIFRRERHRCA